MNNPLSLLLCFLSGCILGAIFFAGLWWTVQKGLVSNQPALWFLGSLMVRVVVVVAGLVLISGGQWERLLTCMVGFLVARVVVIRTTRPRAVIQVESTREVNHSPYL